MKEKEGKGRVQTLMAGLKILPLNPDDRENNRYAVYVLLALLPIALASVYIYGLRTLSVILVALFFGVLTSLVFAIVRKETVHMGVVTTSVLFALTLPPTIPLWIVAVGIVFGVFFGIEVFGGYGRHIFNPALVGRLFIGISFPYYVTTQWVNPSVTQGQLLKLNPFGLPDPSVFISPDGLSSATPLRLLRSGETFYYSVTDLLLGSAPGTMGEIFRGAIIVVGLLLIIFGIISWRSSLSYLASAALFAVLGNMFLPDAISPVTYQLLTGALLFGAFFLAAEPASSPRSNAGQIIYGVALGFLIILMRGYSSQIEGVMFSIVLMNGVAPLIDSYFIKTHEEEDDPQEVTS